MRKAALLVVLCLAPTTFGAPPTIQVRVDSRVELMCIVCRLAGAGEYAMPNSKSTYSQDVDKYFAPFKDHAAIKAMQKMRAEAGVSYDAPMSMALHLNNVVELKPLFDPTHPPSTLDGRWKPAATKDFLIKLRAFVKDAKFAQFLEDHKGYYRKAAGRLESLLGKYAFSKWFDGFFGPRPNARLFATVGLLTGGGNYGVSAQLPKGVLEVSPVIGAYVFDMEGLPAFQPHQAFTLVHEFAHTYTNPLVGKHLPEFSKAAQAMFEANPEQFRSQAYSGGMTVAVETMVRVVTALFLRDCEGEQAGKMGALSEINSGFWWVDGLYERFGEYKDRKKYPTLEAFMPRVVDYFNAVPARLPELKARMPQVVSVSPAAGSKDVDPATTEIRLTFTRPMRVTGPKLIGWVGQRPLEFGDVVLSEDKKTVSFTVKLEKGKTYRFGFWAAVSEEGYRPYPTDFTFSTAE
jgi:hypothetical protein